MSDILQEVDEALKQDKILKLWQDYGNYIIAAVVMVVLMTAAKSGYEYHHKTTSEAATTQLLSILDGEEESKAAALTDFINNAKGGSSIIAQLQLAGEHLNNDNGEDALKVFADIAMNDKATPYFKDFAKLMMVQIKMDTLSDENIKEIQAYLSAIIDDEKSVWRYHALLNRAALSAAGQEYKPAIDDLQKIIDSRVSPPTLAQRARALSQLYTIKMTKSDS